MKKILRQYCESSLNVLNSQYNSTKVLKHNATSGQVREQILKDFLSNHLPELVSVLSGQIIDSNDNYSKQQDIVLVLKSMPRLPFSSGSDLIFKEGVIATFEIKTKLNNNVLKSIGQNIESIRNLKSRVGAFGQMGVAHNWPINRILTSIITYEGASFESILPIINNELSENEKPDLILDLSKGLLIRNHGLLIQKQSHHEYILINEAPQGLELFLIFLTEITGTLSSKAVLWRSYLI